MKRLFALIGFLLIAGGTTSYLVQHNSGGTSSTTATLPASCHFHYVTNNKAEPDAFCTPGMTDSRVTQDNIQATICRQGYTKTVRPPVSFTNPLKTELMQRYGVAGDSPSNYELDHLISLELGGAPSDIKNLWPQPGASPNEKDGVENKLHQLVCSGAITLATAQQAISSDWYGAELKYGRL